jgi:chromosomal replication initiator protein
VKVDRSRASATLEASSMATAKTAREFQAAVEGELAVALGMPRVSVRIFARRRARERARVKEPEVQGTPEPSTTIERRELDPGLDAVPAPGTPSVTLETANTDTRLTLASFIVGPGNEIAHRFATAIAADPGNSYWNPLVLHGGTGTGKTHLVHALANDYLRRYPARRVVIASSERFATQFSLSVRGGQAARFRELYREADLLIIDDIQSLAGKTETEKELLHTIDELVNRRRQVVLASAFAPKRLPKIDAGLEGRLLQGLVVELKPADEPTRERLVRARAAVAKLDLDESIVHLIARRFERTDQVLGVLTRLDAHARLYDRKLTSSEVEHTLGDLLKGKDDAPTPAVLAAFVGQALAIDPEALKGSSRKPAVVQARQLAMALTRRLTSLTLREVGAHFGGRSCACVHFAHRKVALLKERDARVKATYEEALRRFSPPRAR